MDVREELKHLTQKELLELLDLYDTYIIEFCDRNEGRKLIKDVCPCCLMEFYDNEYQEIKESEYY